jgi:hypothetical protein
VREAPDEPTLFANNDHRSVKSTSVGDHRHQRGEVQGAASRGGRSIDLISGKTAGVSNRLAAP